MAHTPDRRPDPPSEAPADAATARPRIRVVLVDKLLQALVAISVAAPLLFFLTGDSLLTLLLATAAALLCMLLGSLLATVLAVAGVGLLLFVLTGFHDRINHLEDTTDAGFARQDARFDELEAKIDEVDLKLTALIAGLNMSEQVDATIEGRLLDPQSPAAEPDPAPP